MNINIRIDIIFWCFVTLSKLLFSANAQKCDNSTDGNFDNSRDCEFELISLSEFTCDGYATCHSITINNTFTEIECHGAASCLNIETNKYSSIYSLQCEGTLSCANSIISTPTTDNLFDTNTDYAATILCYGQYSCMNLVIDNSNNTELIVNDYINNNISDTISNSNTNNIYYTSINELYIHASGHGSLSNFNGSNAVVSYGSFHGYYSAYNSYIIMGNDSTLEFRGRLAGYGAYVLCPANHICEITCAWVATSCYNLTFDCETPDTCNVINCNDETDNMWCPQGSWKTNKDINTKDDLIFYPIQNVDDTLLPNYEYYNQLTNNLRTLKDTSHTENDIIDSLEPFFYNGKCKSSADCDDAISCNDFDITESYFDSFDDSNNDGDIICGRGGQRSLATVTNSQNSIDFGCDYDIACDGDWSCLNNIIYGKNIYFGGDTYYYGGNTQIYSCNDELSNGQFTEIHCGGRFTCRQIDRISNFNNLYCMGDNSCDNVKIDNVNNIFGFAFSLSNTNITVENNQIVNILIDINRYVPPSINIHCKQANEDYAQINIYCFEPGLYCSNNIDFTNCHQSTYNIIEYTGQTIFDTVQPTSMPTIFDPDNTLPPTSKPTNMVNNENPELTNNSIILTSKVNISNKNKSNSNTTLSSNDIGLLIGLTCLGVIILIIFVLLCIFKDRWIWVGEYCWQVSKNYRNRSHTAATVSSGNVMQSDIRFSPELIAAETLPKSHVITTRSPDPMGQ